MNKVVSYSAKSLQLVFNLLTYIHSPNSFLTNSQLTSRCELYTPLVSVISLNLPVLYRYFNGCWYFGFKSSHVLMVSSSNDLQNKIWGNLVLYNENYENGSCSNEI